MLVLDGFTICFRYDREVKYLGCFLFRVAFSTRSHSTDKER